MKAKSLIALSSKKEEKKFNHTDDDSDSEIDYKSSINKEYAYGYNNSLYDDYQECPTCYYDEKVNCPCKRNRWGY